MFNKYDRQQLNRIETLLLRNSVSVSLLQHRVSLMNAQVDKITADIASLQTATQSLIALNDTTQSQLAALIAAGNGATTDELNTIATNIETVTASIQADLAKTPGAPAPAAPAPTPTV